MDKKKTIIFVVRHGEVYNPQHILPGRLPNFHISNHGKVQAKKAGLFLKQHDIDVIYTSPLQRCQETAKIIRMKVGNVPIYTLEELNEIITTRDGESLANLERDRFNFFTTQYRKKGAESMEDVYNRASKALQIIQKKHPGKHIVAVTHGDILIFLKMKLLWNTLEFAFSRGPHYPQPCHILGLQFDKKNHLVQSMEVNLYL